MKKYLTNSVWFIGQNVFSQALLFVVIALVARYIGVEAFGLLSYVLSVSAILAVFGQFGLDSLVVRELVSCEKNTHNILGTVLCLKVIACLAASIAMIAYGHFTHTSGEEMELFYFAATLFPMLPLLTLNHWLQAQEQARYAAISQILGQIFSGMTRVIFVLSSAVLAFFALGNTIQTLVAALFAYHFFCLSGGPRLMRWRFSFELAKKLLAESSIFFLGALLGIIYLKIDVVMLRWLSGPVEVGVYSVAARISEAFYFLPGAILAAIFPALVRLKQQGAPRYERRLEQTIDVMLIAALMTILTVGVAGYFAIPLLFGREFAASSQILLIHVFAMPFVFMGTAFMRWLLLERLTKVFLLTQGLGAVANILLNLALIPALEGKGAAIATVLSYMAALYLSLIIFPKTRPLFGMMTSALIMPWGAFKRAYAIKAEFR